MLDDDFEYLYLVTKLKLFNIFTPTDFAENRRSYKLFSAVSTGY